VATSTARQTEWHRQKVAAMTPVERTAYYRRRSAQRSPAAREQQRTRSRAYMKERRAAMSPEQRRALNQSIQAAHAKVPGRLHGYRTKWRARKRYGLTVAEYKTALARPCDICGRTDKPRVLDHVHNEEPNTRGVLCRRCNRVIGMMQDDSQLLERAATYLRGGCHATVS
jgi:Recombination endonuclease VII